jgi:hypothetical protein
MRKNREEKALLVPVTKEGFLAALGMTKAQFW